MRKCWRADCQRPHHDEGPHWITAEDNEVIGLPDTGLDVERLARALADATNELRLVVKWDADRRAPAMPRWLRVRLHNALPRIRAILDAEIEGKLADTGLDVERLACALDNVDRKYERGWTPAHYARAIAAEYARLTEGK